MLQCLTDQIRPRSALQSCATVLGGSGCADPAVLLQHRWGCNAPWGEWGQGAVRRFAHRPPFSSEGPFCVTPGKTKRAEGWSCAVEIGQGMDKRVGAMQKWQGALTRNSCKFRDEADQGERQRGGAQQSNRGTVLVGLLQSLE